MTSPSECTTASSTAGHQLRSSSSHFSTVPACGTSLRTGYQSALTHVRMLTPNPPPASRRENTFTLSATSTSTGPAVARQFWTLSTSYPRRGTSPPKPSTSTTHPLRAATGSPGALVSSTRSLSIALSSKACGARAFRQQLHTSPRLHLLCLCLPVPAALCAPSTSDHQAPPPRRETAR
jgi:hypothetical protein